ncbi:MAG: ATP-binding cassette domain-containing protein [Dechloromonas sp.]|jgi:ATPase subunit of ABC transporter with duplicated ATPase domains|nr:ATP-binding cassette domain-containing protein [Dechloromonas sp.]
MNLLAVRDLVVGWERPVVGPLGFHVCRGEIVALAGPNGAGKSTLLAALAGDGHVFSGELLWAPGLRLGFQTQGLPPLEGLPLCGRDILGLTGAVPMGLPPWLQDCLDRRLDRLSGGQRQYLALWAILMAPADVLLLDEPTNNLDAAGVAHLSGVLRDRAAAGAGILLVSHDADFAAGLGARVFDLTPRPPPLPDGTGGAAALGGAAP